MDKSAAMMFARAHTLFPRPCRGLLCAKPGRVMVERCACSLSARVYRSHYARICNGGIRRLIHRGKTALGLEFESTCNSSTRVSARNVSAKNPDAARGRCHWFETHLCVHLLSAGTQTGCISPHDPGMQTTVYQSPYATVAYPDACNTVAYNS